MASLVASTESSGSGIQQSIARDQRYACYWLDSCRGQHELTECLRWREELRGKLGIYYSPNGIYKRFELDPISGVQLEYNPTGCTTVHILVYTIRSNGEREILFGLSNRKYNDRETSRRPLLSFPTAKPRKRGEYGLSIAQRAFEWITDQINIRKQGLKSRFLFQHANVIYPVLLTKEQADNLTQNFTANTMLLSLHWFSLALVLGRLPQWENYLVSEATRDDLAQHKHINPTGIQLGEHELWSVTAACLVCIREHVNGGFETFLQA